MMSHLSCVHCSDDTDPAGRMASRIASIRDIFLLACLCGYACAFPAALTMVPTLRKGSSKFLSLHRGKDERAESAAIAIPLIQMIQKYGITEVRVRRVALLLVPPPILQSSQTIFPTPSLLPDMLIWLCLAISNRSCCWTALT